MDWVSRQATASAMLVLAACSTTSRRRAAEPGAQEVPPAEPPVDADAASAGDEADGSGAQTAPPWIRGTSQTRLVQRWDGAERDVDLYEMLSLEFGDERRDAWTGHASARLAWDIDGDSGSTFFSLADSEGSGGADVQLYDAYAETHDRGAWDRIRLGRQFAYETPVGLWFDGIWAQTKPSAKQAWSTGVYGGVPVHAYESSSSGDWLAGVFEEVRPTRALRVRGDYLHLADDTVGVEHGNDLVGVGLFHDAGERLRWDARYSALDGRNRDLALGASWLDPAHDLTLQANFYRLLEEQRSLALELDPFYDTLFTLEPFDETRLSASKGFGEHFQTLAGVDFRRVLDASDVGTFNHDFDRTFVTLSFDRALPGELTLSLTGENWNDDQTDFRTWGADLSRLWGQRFDASIGSFYALYKFDPASGSERDDVRTYYAAVRWRVTHDHTCQLRYEHEEQDIDDFDSLRWGLTWRF